MYSEKITLDLGRAGAGVDQLDRLALSPHEKALYIHLVCAADERVCAVTTRELAAACGISPSAVSNAKEGLQDAGLIEIHRS